MLPSTAQRVSDSVAAVHANTNIRYKYNSVLFFLPEMTFCCKQSSNKARRKKYDKHELGIACTT